MIKYAMIKAILSALAVTTPVAETTYLDTGIYCSDTQSVVDSEGEEWGYNSELSDGTPVIITFDSQGTDSRYDDVITGLTEFDSADITNMVDMDSVVDIQVTDTGALITLDSGDGYYWENNSTKRV